MSRTGRHVESGVRDPDRWTDKADMLQSWEPSPGKKWQYPSKWQMAHLHHRGPHEWDLYRVTVTIVGDTTSKKIHAVDALNGKAAEEVVLRWENWKHAGDWTITAKSEKWPVVNGHYVSIEDGRERFGDHRGGSSRESFERRSRQLNADSNKRWSKLVVESAWDATDKANRTGEARDHKHAAERHAEALASLRAAGISRGADKHMAAMNAHKRAQFGDAADARRIKRPHAGDYPVEVSRGGGQWTKEEWSKADDARIESGGGIRTRPHDAKKGAYRVEVFEKGVWSTPDGWYRPSLASATHVALGYTDVMNEDQARVVFHTGRVERRVFSKFKRRH